MPDKFNSGRHTSQESPQSRPSVSSTSRAHRTSVLAEHLTLSSVCKYLYKYMCYLTEVWNNCFNTW